MEDKTPARNTSHKCCAAALCTNRSDNRKDLKFHAFPKDPKCRIEKAVKMKRSDGKFKSNSLLFCCSEHFVSEDYKHSLTGKRSDLRPQAVPSLFPWTKHKESNDERARRSERREEAKMTDAHSKKGRLDGDELLDANEIKRENDLHSEDQSEVLITWVNYLYIMLGSLPIWAPNDKIKQNLPEGFKGQYEDIRGILDCTEIKCDMPKDYQTHSEMYSDYKSHNTYKGLICITPN